MKLIEQMMMENGKLNLSKGKKDAIKKKEDSIDPEKATKRSTEILNEQHDVRHYTNGILELVDEGIIDGAWLAEGLLKWMSEDDVEDFARVYELKELIDGEEELDESVKKSIKEKFQKRLSEDLKLISDIGDYEPWSGAVETWDKIVQEDKVNDLDFMLEEIYPDGMTMTQLNDLLWFEGETVLGWLGISDIIGEHTYRVTNIVWDADEDDDIDELPSSYNVDIEVEEEDDDIEELVRDALENEFGFSASSFDFELDESLKSKKGSKRIKESVDDDRPLRVCDHCLQAIESHEGPQITKTIYVDDEEYFDSEEEYERESKCDWCDEYGFDTLYEIHGKGDMDFDESCHKDVTEDTVKKGNKWTNRGDTGKEHGEFKTKKAADAQRKAMYARGFKGESKKRVKESNDSNLVNKVAKFIEEAVEALQNDVATCGTYELNESLAVCVGWSAGYDSDDEAVIHGSNDPTWGITAGIKVWTSDSMRTDFDWINAPYYPDGDTIDIDSPIGPDEDYMTLARWFVEEYHSMENWEIAQDGEILSDDLSLDESKKKVAERNLIRSERHNRNMDRIFNTKKEQDKKFADFLRKNGYSEDEIKSLEDADKLNAEIYSKFGGSKAIGDILKESTDYKTLVKLSNGLELISYPYGYAISDGYTNDRLTVRGDTFVLDDGRFKLSDKDKEKINSLIKKKKITESIDDSNCYTYKGYTICDDPKRGLYFIKELKNETFSTDTDAEDRIDSILDESLLKEKSYVKLGTDVGEYQEWVDYDMECYGRVSVETRRKLRDAGLTVVKDKYGDYEVISHDPIDYRKDRRDKFSKRSYKDDDLDESIEEDAEVEEEPRGNKGVGLTRI